MRIVAAEYVSADGRMQMEDPQGLEEERGGWTAPYWNDELAQQQREQLFVSDALLLGRVTYTSFAASWPSFTDEQGFAERMNSIPKYVASRTLEEPLEWNASLLQGDVVEAVRSLKQESGRDLLIYGSGELFNTLSRERLIDEYMLMIHPVILGRGKPLFEDGNARTGLALIGSRATATGVATLVFRQQPDQVQSTP
jgi:dihydrofolate reductase